MKTFTKIFAILMSVVMILSVTACFSKKLSGKYTAEYEGAKKLTLSGTFTAEEDDVEVSYTFKNGNLTIEAMGLKVECTYEITEDDGEYELSITYELLGEEISDTADISVKDDETLVIDGIEFIAEEDIELNYQPTKFSFSGKNVKMTLEGYLLGTSVYKETFEGTYEIKGDEITFEFDDRDAKEWNDTFDFEEKRDDIEIDGIRFES